MLGILAKGGLGAAAAVTLGGWGGLVESEEKGEDDEKGGEGAKKEAEGQSFEHREQNEKIKIVNKIAELPGDSQTVVYGDELALFPQAPNPPDPNLEVDEIGIPVNNDDLFSPNRPDKGFATPKFLVIHTSGDESKDVPGIYEHLKNNNIMTQFVVGKVEESVKAVQCVPLNGKHVNVNGTTSGAVGNDYDANIQFWSSLNVEMQGTPDKVDDSIIERTIDLCVDLMSSYDLKISQIIAHSEVPNNGKGDPGDAVIARIRTEVYKKLLQRGLFHLIDVFSEEDLSNYFVDSRGGDVVEFYQPEGQTQRRVKCMRRGSFCDWDEINSFLTTNHEIKEKFESYRTNPNTGPNIEEETEEIEFRECYLGKPDFPIWIYEYRRPLDGPNYSGYYYKTALANVIKNVYQWITGKSLVGSPFPFSYETTRRIADILKDQEIFTAYRESNTQKMNLSSIINANSMQNRPNQQHIAGLNYLLEKYREYYHYEKQAAAEDDFIQALENYLSSLQPNN